MRYIFMSYACICYRKVDSIKLQISIKIINQDIRQMEERKIMGKKFVLRMTDTAEIMSRQQIFQDSPEHKQLFEKVSSTIRNHVISGGALGLALALSLQRYFPSKFTIMSFDKLFVDTAIITVCLLSTTNVALQATENDLLIIKKQLILTYDQKFLNHMANLEVVYDIQEENQIQGILSQEEYKSWLDQRHQRLV